MRYQTIPEYRERRLVQKGLKPSLEKRREYDRRWRAKNPDKVRAKSSNWKRLHPEEAKKASRATHLKKQFNMTPQQYEDKLRLQGGCCAICRSIPRKRSLHVDHNHKTGQIRGLLCYRCNYALGLLADDVQRVFKMAAYLKMYEYL